MRRLVLLLGVLGSLAFAGTASAHVYYYDTTIDGTPWSNTTYSNCDQTCGGFEAPSCWNGSTVPAGGTKYIINGNNFVHFGFGRWIAGDGIHGDVDSDFVTGPETRQFHFTDGTQVNTRRVWIYAGSFGYLPGIKVVDQSLAAVQVRINC